MKSVFIDIRDQGDLNAILEGLTEDMEIIITKNERPLARITPAGKCTAALHPGYFPDGDDLDDCLPDVFWA